MSDPLNCTGARWRAGVGARRAPAAHQPQREPAEAPERESCGQVYPELERDEEPRRAAEPHGVRHVRGGAERREEHEHEGLAQGRAPGKEAARPAGGGAEPRAEGSCR